MCVPRPGGPHPTHGRPALGRRGGMWLNGQVRSPDVGASAAVNGVKASLRCSVTLFVR